VPKSYWHGLKQSEQVGALNGSLHQLLHSVIWLAQPVHPMINRRFIPFGGVWGWLADVTLSDPTHRRRNLGRGTQSYFAAEPAEYRALAAIRTHTSAGADTSVVLRRAMSRREVALLNMRPGEVRTAK
jgi:hypothetical protein